MMGNGVRRPRSVPRELEDRQARVTRAQAAVLVRAITGRDSPGTQNVRGENGL